MIGLAVRLAAAALAATSCPICPAVPPDAELEPARVAVNQAYLQAGLCPPCADAVLSRAAQILASGPGDSLPNPVVLQQTIQEAGGGDPAPRAMLLSGHDAAAVARDVDQQWRPQPGDGFIGLALAGHSPGVRLALLAAGRKVAVDPLPAHVPAGAAISVRGTMLTALRSPSIYVEGPNGKVAQITPAQSGSRFSTQFDPGAAGRYAVEVLAQGVRGPEVLFLKTVRVGIPVAESTEPPAQSSGREDPEAVLDQINRERQRSGAAALAVDPRLNRVAQSYARELRELGLFAHVSPRSGDLKARLRQAGYRYRSAAENLAEGPTALEAQALAANSPAHRRAMLDPQYTRCGVGLSRAISGEGSADVLLVEVFALDEQ